MCAAVEGAGEQAPGQEAGRRPCDQADGPDADRQGQPGEQRRLRDEHERREQGPPGSEVGGAT